ncbi:MAG: hypothetical protein AB7I50_12755 [Vicinamibacterales bacterium]
MLKGTREGIVRRIQPVSIHGQISLDVQFVYPEDSNGQIQVARLGPEAVESGIEPGDRVQVEFLMGAAVNVKRAR